MKKIKLTTIIFAICCVSFLAFLAFNPSHAYFQSHAQATGVNTAKVDLLFDKFNADEDGNYTIGSFSGNINTDPWGTINNPYVMTGKNHVNNLFILQRSGYFANKKEADGTTPRQSYFVVSNKDGTPIVIDCGGMTINPIGSATNPFTGNIQGAPLAGTAEYGNYTVSQSTIANLNVVAVENTPDIGFFGTLGFVGEDTEPEHSTDANADDVPGTLDGFAASVTNILFADIAIIAEDQDVDDDVDKTDGNTLPNWWYKLFTGHTNYYAEHGETHHVGIVAGHAEWATLKDISVYYTPSTSDATQAKISAFSLGGTNTNYYSVLGIVGTLKYVNPSTTTVGTGDAAKEVFSTKSSVSDEDLELTGGGGTLSGTMTGYMIAKNIFDQKGDATLSALEYYDEAYDVKEFKDGKGEPLFEYRDVEEKSGALFWQTSTTYRYYYFRDSIFTFAMSAKGQINADNSATPVDNLVDYLVQIWKPTSEKSPIKLSTSGNATSGWTKAELKGKNQHLYKLVPASSLQQNHNYVLAYQGNDGKLYMFDLTGLNSGFTRYMDIKDLALPKGTTPETYDNYPVSFLNDGTKYTIYDNTSTAVHTTKQQQQTDDQGNGIVDENNNPVMETVPDKIFGVPVISGYTPKLSGYIIYKRVDVLDSNGNSVPKDKITGEAMIPTLVEVVDPNNPEAEPTTTYVYNKDNFVYEALPLTLNGVGDQVYYFEEFTGLNADGEMETIYKAPTKDANGNLLYILPNDSAIGGFSDTFGPRYSLEKVHLAIENIYTIASETAEFAFTYQPTDRTDVTFSNLAGDKYLCVYAKTQADQIGSFWGIPVYWYSYPTTTVINSINPSSAGDGLTGSDGYQYGWGLSISSGTPLISSNSVTVNSSATFDGSQNTTHYYSILFDISTNSFVVQTSRTRSDVQPTESETANLLLFELTETEVSISAETYIPTTNASTTVATTFDPSKHVLFADYSINIQNQYIDKDGNIVNLTEDGEIDKTVEYPYTLMSLEQLGWNDGNGSLLTQLDHAVKLAQATTGNFQLKFQDLTGWGALDDLLDDWFGQNNGGVVPAPVGTEGTYYTIPSGMIAFDIRAASDAKPSYINIVVAVNPSQARSTIGIHGPMTSGTVTTFDINKPHTSFALPVSTFGRTSDDFNTYKVKVSGYYTKGTDSDGKTVWNPQTNGTNGYYTFLGNEIALVGYSFKVTQPGVYLLGSGSGPMTVCYFSVDGAAGAGNDGTGNLPLGYVDFVYDNGTEILPVTKRDPAESHIVGAEDVSSYYYHSYRYLQMIPTVANTTTNTTTATIPTESIKIRRYLDTSKPVGRQRRNLNMTCQNNATKFKNVSSVYSDVTERNGVSDSESTT